MIYEERFGNEAGGGTEVLVHIRHIVSVELNLVVEVEVRSLGEGTIAAQRFTPTSLDHQSLK